MSELHDRFLQEQIAEGTYHSEGQFTLGTQAAVKMAKNVFAEDSFWLLRLVQAAVASGAESVSVKHTKKATEIAFEAGTPFDVDVVRACLGTTYQDLQSAVSLLVSGLQAVGMGQGRQFSVDFIDSQGHRFLAFLAPEVHCGEGHARRKRNALQRVKLTVPFSGDYRSPVALESSTLTERARACPIEVKLDGRVINNMSPHPKILTDGHLSYLALGAARGPVGASALQEIWAPQTVYAGARWGVTDKFTDSRPVCHMKVPVGPLKVLFQMFYGYKQTQGSKHTPGSFEVKPLQSKLFWLRHGIISHIEDMPWPPHCVALHLYIDATDLPSDASGFAIRESFDSKEARRKEALGLLNSHVQDVLNAVERLWARPFDWHLLAVSGFLGVHSFFIPGFGKLLHLGMLGIAARSSSRDKEVVLRSCKNELRIFAARFRG